MRLLSLLFAWAWSVIAASLGLYSLVKSNQEKTHLKQSAPHGVVVSINTMDVFNAGTAETAAAIFVSIVALLAATPSLFAIIRGASPPTPSRRTLRLEATIFAFSAVWMIAAMIPYTIYFATRSARVTATLGGVALPPKVVEQAQESLHASPVYRDKSYLRLFAVIPWIATLATIIASITSFATAASTKRTASWPPSSEKAVGEHQVAETTVHTASKN